MSPTRRSEPTDETARVKVNEIFYSIQGESSHSGRPCTMVRLTGCQMRCTWCDTAYAFYEGDWMTIAEVLERARAIGCRLVEVTGGEPLLQPGCTALLTALCDRGFEVLLETGGGLEISGVDPRVRRIVDIKCPGSGEAGNNCWDNLAELGPTDEVKLVLSDRTDYEWARALLMREKLTERCAVVLSGVWGELQPRELAEWILEDRLDVRMQVQLHKVLWGSDARGT